MNDKQLTREIIGAAIAVQRELGPGLLEAVYEECLCHELTTRNIAFERQKSIPAVYQQAKLDFGHRPDIVVLRRVMVELKAIASIAPIHEAVMLIHLRLFGRNIGLLINLHSAALKDGIRRFLWHYDSAAEEEKH